LLKEKNRTAIARRIDLGQTRQISDICCADIVSGLFLCARPWRAQLPHLAKSFRLMI